jgi:hypothetical protein
MTEIEQAIKAELRTHTLERLGGEPELLAATINGASKDEIRAAAEQLNADRYLLATIGRWGDTLDDEEVLANLGEWNAGAAAEKMSPGSGSTLAAVGEIVPGLALVSQSCDIVRSCKLKPYVDVAPLVEVDEKTLEMARLGRTVAVAYLPAVAKRRLVADLERVQTVEKAIVADWQRVAGCHTDEEARNFAEALRRKRGRFAFPDDFVALAACLSDRIKQKHNKNTREGEMLRALREIRVRGVPSWNAERVDLTFLFIKDGGPDPADEETWAAQLKVLLALVKPQGRYVAVSGYVTTLDDITARDLVESDPLDFDHLSRDEG